MQERQEIQLQSLGLEEPLEKEMATCSSVVAWKIAWTEEPGGLQSKGSQRVRHDECAHTHTHTFQDSLTDTAKEVEWSQAYRPFFFDTPGNQTSCKMLPVLKGEGGQMVEYILNICIQAFIWKFYKEKGNARSDDMDKWKFKIQNIYEFELYRSSRY